MVRCLADAVDERTCTRGRRHDAVIARFEEFLEANLDRPLYLTEICAAIGVAERTLRASCEEHLGMGPIRFLTLRRMHLAHSALLRAYPSKSTVTRIATRAIDHAQVYRRKVARASGNSRIEEATISWQPFHFQYLHFARDVVSAMSSAA
jgi:AraC-like DNA-binding protein